MLGTDDNTSFLAKLENDRPKSEINLPAFYCRYRDNTFTILKSVIEMISLFQRFSRIKPPINFKLGEERNGSHFICRYFVNKMMEYRRK